MVVVLGGLGLWSTNGTVGTRQLNLPASVGSEGSKTLRLHFAKDTEDGMTIEERSVNIAQGEDVLARALEELIKGPQTQGAAPLVPAGTPVPTLFLRDNLALVDLPGSYSKLNFDIARENALIYGIASTLLEFKEVEAVKFLLGGKEVESLGHLSLLDPFKRQ